jgi:anaerobic dimethyl sulfoxide reductase subunit B (iron-sulfur subunit)
MARQYGFYIRTDRCVQCSACEVGCKSWNSLEPGVRWRRVVDFWDGEFPVVANRTISLSCMHCEQPACAAACPAAAIVKRPEDGAVMVIEKKCTGCRTCAEACPFGAPQYGRNGRMQKCNMCVERRGSGKEPLCVATCPGEVLRFGPVDELAVLAAAKSGARLAAATEPAFFISGKSAGKSWLSLIQSLQSPRS